MEEAITKKQESVENYHRFEPFVFDPVTDFSSHYQVEPSECSLDWGISLNSLTHRPVEGSTCNTSYVKLRARRYYNLELGFDLKVETGEELRAVWRYWDRWNHYALVLGRGGSSVVRVYGGVESVLGVGELKITDGGKYKVRVVVTGDVFEVIITEVGGNSTVGITA